MHGSFMRVIITEPFFFPPLLGNQGEIAVITLHKYNIAEPLELIGKFQNYASFVGKSEQF